MLVGEVATVEDGMQESATMASVNGVPTVVLEQVRKQSGTNTVQIIRNLKLRIEELRRTLPAGYDASYCRRFR